MGIEDGRSIAHRDCRDDGDRALHVTLDYPRRLNSGGSGVQVSWPL